MIKIGRKGFTLIELLVVISIIGLLSSIVMVSLSTARKKAKDSKRIQGLVQLRTALELYKSSLGTYPPGNVTMVAYSSCANLAIYPSGIGKASTYSATNWIPNLSPTHYSAPLPTEPNGCYVYISNGVDYKLSLLAGMETDCLTTSLTGFCSAPALSGVAYSASIYTTGGAAFTVPNSN